MKSLTSLIMYYLNTSFETVGKIPKQPTPRLMISLKCVNTLNSIFRISMTQTNLYFKEATKLRQTENTGHRRHTKKQLIGTFVLLSSHIGSRHGEWRELTCFSLPSVGRLLWFCQLSGSKIKAGGCEGRQFGSPQLYGSGHSKKRVRQGCTGTKRKYWNSLE